MKQLGASLATVSLAGRSAFADADGGGSSARAFNFLVVGDSLVWGQGLREEEKFYQLTKRWLEVDFFKNERRVELKNKAHSGASIDLKPYEIAALERAEFDENETYHPEINVSFPSIRSQINVARKEYENPQAVDLIMLTGGVTDVRLTKILNPTKDNDELRSEIATHCNEKMFALLDTAAASFPNALIVVAGYYPFLSKFTPKRTIFNNVLEMYEVPPALKVVINNPLNRQLLKRYRRKMVERSMIWAENSTREYQKAIDQLNAKFGTPRAVFVASPIGEENSMGTQKSLLYEVGKNGEAADALAAERKTVCRKTLDELRKATNLKLRSRVCELATVGHPTPEGARLYAEAVTKKLAVVLQNKLPA